MKKFVDIIDFALVNDLVIDHRITTEGFPIYNDRYFIYSKEYNVEGQFVSVLKVYVKFEYDSLLVYSYSSIRQKKNKDSIEISNTNYGKFHHKGPWENELEDAFDYLNTEILEKHSKEEMKKQKLRAKLDEELELKAEKFRKLYSE